MIHWFWLLTLVSLVALGFTLYHWRVVSELEDRLLGKQKRIAFLEEQEVALNTLVKFWRENYKKAKDGGLGFGASAQTKATIYKRVDDE